MDGVASQCALGSPRDYLNLYREIFLFSNDGIAIIDLDGRYVDQNDAHRRLIGYQDEELRDQTPAIHLGQEQFERVAGELKRTGSYRGEVISRTKRGDLILLEISAATIRNASGEPVAYVGIKRDISERKRFEAELQRRYHELEVIYELTETVNRAVHLEEVYQAALEAIRQALRADRASILLFDPDGMLRFKAWVGLSEEYRQSVEGHSPWSPEQSSPRPISIENVATADDLGHLKAVVLKEGIQALAFFPLTFQRRLLGKFMVYFSAPHSMSEEQKQLAQSIANHIASSIDRKRGEQLRYETAQTLHAVVNASPLGIIAVDRHGSVMMWNAAAERTFGWKADECVGKTPPHIPRDKQKEFEQLFRQVMAGQAVGGLETQQQRRDGSVIDVLVYAAPLKGMPDTIIGMVGVIADITTRKTAEAERERLVAELQAEHRALLDTQAELSSRLQELEKFEEVVVGRELKMIELERELKRLQQGRSASSL